MIESRVFPDRMYAQAMDADRARQLLANVRRRITGSLGALEPGESDEPATELQVADQDSVLYERELDEGLSDRLRDELMAVERAEQRLAAGTYGISIESGEPIPDERLEAVPTAERTAEEQARYERGA